MTRGFGEMGMKCGWAMLAVALVAGSLLGAAADKTPAEAVGTQAASGPAKTQAKAVPAHASSEKSTGTVSGMSVKIPTQLMAYTAESVCPVCGGALAFVYRARDGRTFVIPCGACSGRGLWNPGVEP